MITFFTHCRPFDGEFDRIQTAAISSWMSVADDVQVILVGEHRVDVAERLKIDHEPLSGYNEFGTPLINALFEAGQARARHDIMCEISSDIILSADCAAAFAAMAKHDKPFMVGARWDVDRGEYDEPVMRKHPGSAADWFGFRRGTLGDIPPFAIGRTIYDQWLMWAAQNKWDMMTIDATDDVFAIHLNHGYPEYGNKAKMLQSHECKINHNLAGKNGYRKPFNVEHTEYVMSKGEVTKR